MASSQKCAHLIANKKSGKGRGGSLAEEAKTICDELGFDLKCYNIEDCDKAVDNAEKDGGVVIAAGGDGTIRGVAQVASGRNVKFAAVPCGTFNFFARTHKIPEDHLEAFRLALTGQVKPVRLGQVNEHIFLINASLGLYAKAIQEREMRTSRFGRNRLVVIISTLISFFSSHSLLRVDLGSEGKVVSLRTPMIFIGNNALQLRNLALDVAGCMKENMLGVVLMRPLTKIEVLRVIFRGFFKTLDDEKNMDTFCVDEMTIHTRKPYQLVALDGEMLLTQSPLKIKSLPGILNLVLATEVKI